MNQYKENDIKCYNYKRFQVFSFACALLMLIILFVSITFTSQKSHLQNPTETTSQSDIVPEYVYVFVEPQCSIPHDTASYDDEGWIIREYNGIIGVFTHNGVFLRSIDTHIKTLPKADRELLREGISVKTRKELIAIIEDYTE